jgi:hypothetical protein
MAPIIVVGMEPLPIDKDFRANDSARHAGAVAAVEYSVPSWAGVFFSNSAGQIPWKTLKDSFMAVVAIKESFR